MTCDEYETCMSQGRYGAAPNLDRQANEHIETCRSCADRITRENGAFLSGLFGLMDAVGPEEVRRLCVQEGLYCPEG